MDTSTPAVVLKFDRNPMHHGGLGAIRTLGRLGVPVHGVHEYRWAPAAGSRYLADRWVWRPSGDPDRILADLTGLARRIGRPAVLVPTDDAASIFLAEHGGPLRGDFLFPEPPAELPRTMAGKFSMYQLCQRLGVPCPETALPATLDEARDFAARTGYPLVAKLATPWTPGGGVRSTTIVTDGAQLADLYLTCANAGAGLLLQEFVPDGNDSDWFCHAYVGRDGRCRPVFTGVKERSYPAHAGLTSMGRSMPNTRLATQLTALLHAIDYRGIVDVDVRLDHRDGRYHVLDLNPRLGAQFRLFRDTEGMDVVLAQYLDLTGQDVPTGEPVAGRGFVVENYDPVAAYRYWRGGQLGLTAWLDSLRGRPETAWFASDDPLPFALMCVRTAWRVASRPFAGTEPAPRTEMTVDKEKERT